MTVREFNEKLANYIETQREYSRRLAANEPAEKLADLKATLDEVAAIFNFFDAHGNALTGEDLVKHVDGMQDEYRRTIDINSPFIFVNINGETPQMFAINAKSTGAGPSGEVKLSIDPKPLTEEYYNEKYRPDDLKVYEKPKEPGFFARVYNWFHKQFNDGLESDTFRAYNKAVHKYEKMHHFHTREIQPKNNGKMNYEMEDVPEMPDRTKMSEADYEKALKAYNDYHEFTPKPKEYYEKGIADIQKKLGLAGEFEGEELENLADIAIMDKGNLNLEKDLGEKPIDEVPTVDERDMKRIEMRVEKLGDRIYGENKERWSEQAPENLRNFRYGLISLYNRDDIGKSLVMNVDDTLLDKLYRNYEDFYTDRADPVGDLFDLAKKQLDAGKQPDQVKFPVPEGYIVNEQSIEEEMAIY